MVESEVPREERSGFRLRAPASLTPARRLNFALLGMTILNGPIRHGRSHAPSPVSARFAARLAAFRLSRRGRAAQQAFGAEVFVYIRPMDSISAASNLPMGTLRSRGAQETRIPRQPYRNRATVHQPNGQ